MVKRKILKLLAYTHKLTSYQKFASRVGYMGAGFLIAGQWTLDPKLFIIGFCCVIVQVLNGKESTEVYTNLIQVVLPICGFKK